MSTHNISFLGEIRKYNLNIPVIYSYVRKDIFTIHKSRDDFVLKHINRWTKN